MSVAGAACLRHRGACWAPLISGRRFGVYLRSPDLLACVQEQVEDYESMVYQALLKGACGRDGVVRPRARVLREDNGTLRAFGAHLAGGEDV